ncbi:hypothetical protein Cgig2_019678 [Carnegiea gigantea]|uniref:Protein kinase domain-containing protein n=1 Tax=Carnegiea gigantea TaxID=171969 RepID=A0A9Q1K0Y5_9CARY|nr:hypothetical protein Cgig2_019678 [Carnegiea gigantea]
MKEFDYEQLKKATQGFCPSKIVGKGSHGCVYKGVLGDGKVVAIKKLSTGLSNLQDNSKLENEASILSSLPKMTNLVSLLGSTHPDLVTNSMVLVMEFMPNGSLHDSLHANSPPTMLLSWSRRVKIAVQLAKSLEFLHSLKPKVVHRDVKSANVLFDKDCNAKLGDFGLAVRLKEGDANLVDSVCRPAGTIGYMDPCYTTPCMLSTRNDVFSFGVMLLEIISGQKVIDASRSKTYIVDWVLPLIENRKFELIFDPRVTIPASMEGTVRKLLAIAVRCIGDNCNRPTMNEIVGMIILKRKQKSANRKRSREGSVLQYSTTIDPSMQKLLLTNVLADDIY